MTARRQAVVTFVVTVGLSLAAIVVGLLVGWFVGDHSRRDWVLSFAGASELFGVLLVATPEIVPLVRRCWLKIKSSWRWIKRQARRAADWIRRLIGRPPKTHPADLKMSGSVGLSGSGSMDIATGYGESIGEKVDYLLRRDRETHDRLKEISAQLKALPDRLTVEMKDEVGKLRRQNDKALQELRDSHMRARLFGLALLVLGIVLNTWGNLI